MNPSPVPRRGFVGRLAGMITGIGAVGALGADGIGNHATASGRDVGSKPDESWLTNMKGVHRQIFDTPAIAGGRVVPHVRNYLDTYKSAYGLEDSKLSAAIMAYSSALPLLFTDAAWSKYKFGDESKNTNASALNALHARGVVLLGCNNTLNRLSGEQAAKRNESAAAVRADLLAHLLPGVIMVPAAVIALNRAQESGVTSFYCG